MIDNRSLDISLAEKLFGLKVVGWETAVDEDAGWLIVPGQNSEGSYYSKQPLYVRECICQPGVKSGEQLFGHHWICLEVVPHYSSDHDWTGMKLVVEKMREKGWQCQMNVSALPGSVPYGARFLRVVGLGGDPLVMPEREFSENLPLAVAIAAIDAIVASGGDK